MSCVTGVIATTSATACWIGRPDRIMSSSKFSSSIVTSS